MIKKAYIKKIVLCCIVFCLILVFQSTAFAAQAMSLKYDNKSVKYTGITYKININNVGVKTDFPGIVFNKVTMLPLRAVFEQLGAKVTWSSKTQLMDITYNSIQLQFKNNDNKVKLNGKTIKLGAPVKKINDRLLVPIEFLKNIEGVSLEIDNKVKTINILLIGTVQEVSSVSLDGKDIVTLKMSSHNGFEAIRKTNPNKIVIDFKNVKTSEEVKTIKADLNFVRGINISSLDTNSTRVEIELEGMDNFNVLTVKGGCKIIIEKPISFIFSYENSYDRVYFSVKNINLANVSSTITNYYKEAYDPDNNKYTISIPSSSNISYADETFNINDALVSNIEIYRDKVTSDTNIVFHTKQKFKFFTSYNVKRKQTEINLLTPAKDDERLVVIDAGHGGQDPGATKNSVYEKDLNLAIALKLEKLLKNNNIKTFMLRQDDTFVGLYDRPYIANELNATLFLSIHNNSIDSRRISGTETLYYPEFDGDTSFTGEKFANMIQESLISNLKTVNRKTVERPGLVVLKYTKMPSALAEIGFLTNSNDLKNLCSQSFQQKTAEALCNAIVKSLEQIELEKKASIKIEPENIVNTELDSEEAAKTQLDSEKDVDDNIEKDKAASADIEEQKNPSDNLNSTIK